MKPLLHRRFLTTTLLRVVLTGTGALFVLVPAAAVGPLLHDTESFAGGSVAEVQNSGVGGNGVLGQSITNGGNGVVGSAITTTSRPASVGVRGTANGPYAYGVYGSGDSPDSSSPSVGVLGISTGTVGVYGVTESAQVPATLGYNPNSTTGVGIEGFGSGNGVIGVSSNLNGVVGETYVNSGKGEGFSGVYGTDLSTDGGESNSGVYGMSGSALGVEGGSGSGAGVLGVSAGGTGVVASTDSTPTGSDLNGPPALQINANGGAPAIIAAGETGQAIFSLDAMGDLVVGGNLTVDGSVTTTGVLTCKENSCAQPLVRPQKTAANVEIGMYAPEETERTVEDVGEAQLVNGSAYVRMDAAFASAIDSKSSYLVFITPAGDSRGLYVTGRTHSGFYVHENGNGHSSLAFDYRIAAKPFGATETRLPVLAARAANPLPRPLSMSRARLRFAQVPLQRIESSREQRAGFIPKAPRPPVQPAPIR